MGKLTDEVKARLEELYDETNPDTGKPYTLDELTALVDVPKPTIGRHRKTVMAQRDDAARMEGMAVEPDAVALFENTLRDTPGLGPGKAEWAIKVVKTNPQILTNPQELYQLLREGVGLRDYFTQQIIRGIMSKQSGSGTGPGSMFFPGQPPGQQPPAMYGQPHAPQQPWGYPPQAPGYAPPWGAPPWGPPPWAYWQQPTASKTLDKDDIEEIVEKIVSKAMPATPASETVYEESQEPVIGADGNPMMGPDGSPIFRFIRRPVRDGRDTGGDVVTAMAKLKESGLIQVSQRDPNIETMLKNQERLIESLAAGPRGGDPELRTLLETMRTQQATMMAELGAEKARREEAEKWSGKLDATQRDLRDAAVRAATAEAGMPADAVVLNKSMDAGEKALAGVLANQQARMGRLESLAARLLVPPTPGVPSPPTTSDVAALIARQAAIDASEGHAHVDATTMITVDPKPPSPPTTSPVPVEAT